VGRMPQNRPSRSSLLRWVATDRAVLTLGDPAEVAAQQEAIVALVNRWVAV